MKLGDIAAYSWANLRRHKLRTALTVCGVGVGVATLTLLVSLGFGLERQATQYFQGAELATRITVLPEGTKSQLFRGVQGRGEEGIPLTDETVAELEEIRGVQVAYPGVYARVTAESPRQLVAPLDVEGLPVEGLTKPYQEGLLAGRYWGESDAGRVGVLPSQLLSDLGYAEAEDALGEDLALSRLDSLFRYERVVEGGGAGSAGGSDASPAGGSGEAGDGAGDAATRRRVRFERPEGLETVEVGVVGVYDSEKFGYMGQRMHVPLPFAGELADEYGFMGSRGGQGSGDDDGTYPMLIVKVDDPSSVDPVRKSIEDRGFDTMTVFDILWVIQWVFIVFEVVLGLFGGIGLLVAFFGIANTMVMAVLERTREIGVLKALGARNRDIRRMVFVEAASIGLAGGAAGLFIGWGIGMALNGIGSWMFASQLEGEQLSVFYVPLVLVGIALAVSTVVAAIAGIYPAWRAARLDPVVSLRTE